MQEVEGSTPTWGTWPNIFSDPIDQDIRTQWALSCKIVVSEWRSVIAVSLNVGGGVRLIKPAKLYTNTQNTTYTTRTDARRRVCAAMVPYRWATRGTSLRELEYTHTPNLNRCLLYRSVSAFSIVFKRFILFYFVLLLCLERQWLSFPFSYWTGNLFSERKWLSLLRLLCRIVFWKNSDFSFSERKWLSIYLDCLTV